MKTMRKKMRELISDYRRSSATASHSVDGENKLVSKCFETAMNIWNKVADDLDALLKSHKEEKRKERESKKK